MGYIYLAMAILAEVVATSALKASDEFSRLWPSVTVCIGYAIAFYALSLSLRTLSVGVAYAIWSGLGIVLITIVGWVFFRQSIDVAGAVGMAMIVAGVAVIQLFSAAGKA